MTPGIGRVLPQLWVRAVIRKAIELPQLISSQKQLVVHSDALIMATYSLWSVPLECSSFSKSQVLLLVNASWAMSR